MSSMVLLYIFEPDTGAMVAQRWLGERSTLKRALAVLNRPPDQAGVGIESWGRVTAAEASQIAESSYVDGATPEDILELERAHPSLELWWIIAHFYPT